MLYLTAKGYILCLRIEKYYLLIYIIIEYKRLNTQEEKITTLTF